MKTINLPDNITVTIRPLKFDKQGDKAVRIVFGKVPRIGTVFEHHVHTQTILTWAKKQVKQNKHLFTTYLPVTVTEYMGEN